MRIQTSMEKGIHLEVDQWTVSVQWGPGNYCDNYSLAARGTGSHRADLSGTVEVAVWNDKTGHWCNEDGSFSEGARHVWGWVDLGKVFKFLAELEDILTLSDEVVGALCVKHLNK